MSFFQCLCTSYQTYQFYFKQIFKIQANITIYVFSPVLLHIIPNISILFQATYQTYQLYFKQTFEIFPLQHIFNSEPQRLGTIDARILICVNFNLHITTTRELKHKSALH